MCRFLSDTTGSTTIMTGFVLAALLAAGGAAVDYSRMVDVRSSLQDAVDAATLAAARTSDPEERRTRFDDMMRTNTDLSKMISMEDAEFTLQDNGSALVGTVEGEVKLMFGGFGLIGDFGTVEASASVGLSDRKVEVALVVDVSSSMIEQGRFDPAKDAVRAFATRFDALPNTRIALVPFSSRVNYGLSRQSLFGSWNGAEAIPDRWLSPDDHYNTNYTRLDWIDNETFAMTRELPQRRVDWMGCAEPRFDVSVERGQTSFAPSDVSPAEEPLVAMDHNPAPGKTFCPPPVTALTADLDQIRRAADALTSQGSTRLDAGMAAGWYALSPHWAQAWGAGNVAAPYDDADTIKVIVFMTDGAMNTMDNPANANEYDWACQTGGDCDAEANTAFLSTCEAIKAAGIEIHTVSYDPAADRARMESCASTPGTFHIAESEPGEAFIETIYGTVADRILSRLQVLTR